MPLDVQQFEEYRPLLFGIAYRMLGSASEAEDAVQDAYLRSMAVDQEAIRAPRAFLSTVVTRLCLDRLKAARMSREQYIGPWLPEPLIQQPSGGAGEEHVEREETVSVAMLVLMEQLSPVERAVFLLHAAFELPFDEIGAMVGRSAAACRQAYHRARGHLDARRPRFRVPPEQRRRLVDGSLAAAREGDLPRLTALLSEQAVYVSDGGGAVQAALRPIHGADKVARLMLSLTMRALAPGGPAVRFAQEWVNGEPGLLVWEGGQLSNVILFTCGPDAITAINVVRNPTKLVYLAASVMPPGEALNAAQ
jgi:RNA polymerase sigma-70 factor (ECF subfamily)